MQNNSSQPKNGKSTARETRPTLVEKMAMLEEIYVEVSRCVFVLAAVSRSINQSINWTIINWKMLRELNSEILPTVIIWRKKCFDATYFEVVISELLCGEK